MMGASSIEDENNHGVSLTEDSEDNDNDSKDDGNRPKSLAKGGAEGVAANGDRSAEKIPPSFVTGDDLVGGNAVFATSVLPPLPPLCRMRLKWPVMVPHWKILQFLLTVLLQMGGGHMRQLVALSCVALLLAVAVACPGGFPRPGRSGHCQRHPRSLKTQTTRTRTA